MLERKLELLVLIQLNTSTQRLDGIMEMTEMSANNLAWHAEQHLDDPEYMDTLVYNLVKSNGNYIVGAAVLFRPNYYPGKGYWFEPYARHRNDTVTLEQIGSSQHDYTKSELYQTCMRGDTLRWNMPYLDAEGAQGYVTTFAIPIRDEKGVPVAALAQPLQFLSAMRKECLWQHWAWICLLTGLLNWSTIFARKSRAFPWYYRMKVS